ncbi:MAG: histidine phosphatase family protein [Planctomycetota bacterium]
MNKQLLVMRHAKSSWTEEGKTDYERQLNKRGRRVAPQMGQLIRSEDLVPDKVFSSSATRAAETTKLFAEECEVDQGHIQYVKYLYHAPADEYLELIDRFDEPDVEVLMVVGHNPGLEELVYSLSHQYETMPTAAIAHFDLGVEDWITIRRPYRATLKSLWRPKEVGIA